MTLSKKELAYIDEYFICGMRRSEAARRLGSKQPWNYAYRMMRNDEVLAEIDRRMKERHLSANEVIARLSDMASSNMSDFASIRTAKDVEDLPNGHVIKKIKRKIFTPDEGDPYEEIELELYAADANLERVGRYLRLFDRETGTDDSPFIVKVIKGVNVDDL